MAYTVNYVPIGAHLVGMQPISSVGDSQAHPLGMIVQAFDTGAAAYGTGEFIYLKGVANTAQGSWVSYYPDGFTTALLVTDAVGAVAIAMAATVANKFGWYQISGKSVGKVAASCADDAVLYTTGTAGTADDGVAAGELIVRAVSASAIDTPATGFAEIELNRPHVQNAATV